MKRFFTLIFLCVFSVTVLAVYQQVTLHDDKLHLIFCDVGQGDAIFIKTPSSKHILIDGGPDRKVLDCLSRHLAFWERKLDIVRLTHLHADHYSGIYYVIDRYAIKSFDTEENVGKNKEFSLLKEKIIGKKIPLRFVTAGDRWVLTTADEKRSAKIYLSILAPKKTEQEEISSSPEKNAIPENMSLVSKISYLSFNSLLTADAQSDEIELSLKDIQDHISVLQISHHGSTTGITDAILNKIKPDLAVISVGAKNRYGHPNKTVLQMLAQEGIRVLRTDMNGDIEIVTDGKNWNVEKIN
jgi:competence protein ComEC